MQGTAVGGIRQLSPVAEFRPGLQDDFHSLTAPHTSPCAVHEERRGITDSFGFRLQPPAACGHNAGNAGLVRVGLVQDVEELVDERNLEAILCLKFAHSEIGLQQASMQRLEVGWREELASSQMREAGLRVEVEATRRELAEYRWNMLVDGPSNFSEFEAAEAKSFAIRSPDDLQDPENMAHASCSCYPSSEFLEARLALLRHQLVNLQEEVAASTASEETLRDEVLASPSKFKAEVAELSRSCEIAEVEANRFRNEALEARSDQAILQAEVAPELETRLALMIEEEGVCRKELSASALTVAMLRSEVNTAYHEANQIEAKWRKEFQAAEDHWRQEFQAAQDRWREELNAGSEIASSSTALPTTPPRSQAAVDIVGGSLQVPQKMLRSVPSPQRLVAPPPGWQSNESSAERSSRSPNDEKLKQSSVKLPVGSSKSASSTMRRTSATSGAPPPSLTPPVSHSTTVPYAPWGLNGEATSSGRLLPAPRLASTSSRASASSLSPHRTQPQQQQSAGPYLIQRMISAPSLRQVPLECATSLTKLPSECTTSAGMCSSSQRLTPTPRSSCSSPTQPMQSGSYTSTVAGEATGYLMDTRRQWPHASPGNAVLSRGSRRVRVLEGGFNKFDPTR